MSDEKKTIPHSDALGRSRAALDRGLRKDAAAPSADARPDTAQAGREKTGGPEGPDPTRYGDWERKGRCIDF